MRLELYVPDQETPNALSAEQQDVIDRFRRDIIGAQHIVVSVQDTVTAGDVYEKIFESGSVPHASAAE